MQRKTYQPSVLKKPDSKFRLPDFSFEKKLWKRNFKIVAGVDEVGRGSFAGPVVTAAVAFAPVQSAKFRVQSLKITINDSKKLTPKQREKANKWIKENALYWAVGEASVNEINKLGIVKATQIAFRKAISKTKADFLLIDAFYIPYVAGLRRKNQKAIIKGDTKSISIAAASIIAKVYRDKLMTDLSKKAKYKEYGWDKNKGYGTLDHRNAIKKYGLTRLHRRDFVRKLV